LPLLFKRVPQRAFLGVFEEPIVFCCDDTDRVRGSLAHRGADNRKKQPKATSLEPALPSTSRADKQDLVISNIAMELFKFLTRKKSTSALITTLSLYNNLQSYSEGEQSTQPVTLPPNICLASVSSVNFFSYSKGAHSDSHSQESSSHEQGSFPQELNLQESRISSSLSGNISSFNSPTYHGPTYNAPGKSPFDLLVAVSCALRYPVSFSVIVQPIVSPTQGPIAYSGSHQARMKGVFVMHWPLTVFFKDS